MALDLSGFLVPEQKYEGLYKIGDALASQRAAEAKAKKDAADAAAKALKEQKKNQLAGQTYLTGLTSPTNTKTLDFLRQGHVNSLYEDIVKQGQALNLAGASVPEMAVALSPMVTNAVKTRTNLDAVAKTKAEILKTYGNQKGVDANAIADNYEKSKLYDDNGALKTQFSDIQFGDDDELKALTMGNVYNPESFDEFVKGNAKETRGVNITEEVGKKKVVKNIKTSMPNDFSLEKDLNGQYVAVPKYNVAVDPSGVKLMHTIINDGKEQEKELRMVDEDVYNQFNKKMKDYLDQEAAKFVSKSEKPPSATEIHQFKKALGYHLLENSSKKGVNIEQTQAVTTKAKGAGGGGGSQSAIKLEKDKNRLFRTIDKKPRDADGNVEITPFMNQVTVIGNMKANQGMKIMFNPKTHNITVVDTDGNKTNVDFDEFINTLQTSNTELDKNFISTLEDYKEKTNAPKVETRPIWQRTP